jgi:hypothetical protein
VKRGPDTDLVAALRRRLRRQGSKAKTGAAIVIVDGVSHRASLAEKPPVGATIDVGFPARVTESKTVAGGGFLVAAEKIDQDAVPRAD